MLGLGNPLCKIKLLKRMYHEQEREENSSTGFLCVHTRVNLGWASCVGVCRNRYRTDDEQARLAHD